MRVASQGCQTGPHGLQAGDTNKFDASGGKARIRSPQIFVFLSLVPIFSCFISAHPAVAHETPTLLQQARGEKDLTARIALLNQALQDPNLKGGMLAALFLERGMAHKSLKQYVRAIEDFDSVMAHSRRSFLPLLEKAECLIQLDQLDEASGVLELYLLMQPGNTRAYVLKGMIYEKEGALSKAEDEYTRALHYEPESIPALEMRSKVLQKAGKLPAALDDAEALVKIARPLPEIFVTRARIHARLEHYDEALKDYGKAEVLGPGDDNIRKEKVLIYFKTGRPAKALEELSHSPAIRADDVATMVLRARAHILLKEDRKAEQLLKQALTKEPGHGPAYLYRAVVLMRAGDIDEALANLNRSLDLDPKNAEAFKERARIFMNLKEYARAAADLTTAGALDPADGEVFALRGLTFYERMLYDAASTDFTHALENLPGDPKILYDRAVIFTRKEEYEAALADVDAVLRVKPDAARALSLRGIIQFMLGNVPAARMDVDKACQLVPHDATLWNNRGFLYYKSGNFQAARESFNRALQLDSRYERARYNLSLVLNKESIPSEPEPARAPDRTSSGTGKAAAAP
jgi:tetratricopeptide (TPR) repeat protein